MNRRGHRGKIDANHEAIVSVLRRRGLRVRSLAAVGDGMADLLVLGPNRQVRLVEVKADKGRLTPDQEAFLAEGWPVTIVRSVEDALAL